MIFREFFKEPNEPARYPTVTAAPEDLLPVCFAFAFAFIVDQKGRISGIEAFLFVVETVVGFLKILVVEFKVGTISGDRGKFCRLYGCYR